jgi:hypothetical protein
MGLGNDIPWIGSIRFQFHAQATYDPFDVIGRVTADHLRRESLASSTHDGPYADKQLSQAKRLDQVVISPRFQWCP